MAQRLLVGGCMMCDGMMRELAGFVQARLYLLNR